MPVEESLRRQIELNPPSQACISGAGAKAGEIGADSADVGRVAPEGLCDGSDPVQPPQRFEGTSELAPALRESVGLKASEGRVRGRRMVRIDLGQSGRDLAQAAEGCDLLEGLASLRLFARLEELDRNPTPRVVPAPQAPGVQHFV